MKLICKSDYNNTATGARYAAGEIEVSEAEGAFLLADAPENFAAVKVVKAEKAMDEPPADKQVKSAPKKK